MSAWLDFKYDHPYLHALSLLAASITLGTVLAVAVPDSEVTRALGLSALRQRGSALCSALYWETRAHLQRTPAPAAGAEYGYVSAMEPDGAVLITVPQQHVFVQRRVQLANVRITDLAGASALILRRRHVDARVEHYGAWAVIWFDDRPLNLDLINAGLAVPVLVPPTSILERLFADYLWNQTKGTDK